MRELNSMIVVFACVLALTASSAAQSESDAAFADEMTLKAAGLSIDGPGLLEFFRDRAQTKVEVERIRVLMNQLRSDDPSQRDDAAAALLRIGAPTIPWLLQTVKETDADNLAQRAQRLLTLLQPPQAAELTSAATRVLARRQPACAAQALLDFLPVAESSGVVDEIRTALTSLAYQGGKPEWALVTALQDPLPLRRSMAIDALGVRGISPARTAIRGLLEDSNPIVRLRAALALANAREAPAIATLIGLLVELPPAQARQAEEFLFALAGEQAPNVPLGDTAETREKCRDAWIAWWKSSEAPGLLDEIRRRTFRPAENSHVLALVRQLGDDQFDARQKAQASLQAMGKAVVPALRHAMSNPDLEVSSRARQLFADIEKDAALPLSPVLLRLVALRKPPGATEAILTFIANADEGNIPEEMQESLNALSYANGQPDPVVMKALSDPSPLARGAAAEALCQFGATETVDVVRSLMKDPDSVVRMRAGLALTTLGNRDAIATLISLLSELPPDRASVVEDYLLMLAQHRAPKLPTLNASDAREKRRDAWAAWWQENSARVEICAWNRGSESATYHGFTLLTLAQTGQVVELGMDGKTRWQLAGLQNPSDAEVLSGQRVLVAEIGANRVTERNLRGDILWQKAVNYPLSAQRLANGNTFITMRNQLLEVDRGGKEVLRIDRQIHDIMAARKLRDGQIALVTQSACLRLDGGGKELKSFALPNGPGTYYVDFTPKGHLIIPQSWANKVYEYDPDGKVLSETNAQQPMAVARLPNGNTLVYSQVWPPKVIEVDRSGKTVWEHQPATPPGRVRRR